MPISRYKKRQIDFIKLKAWELYKKGLSLRKVAEIVGYSYGWVWLAVKEFERKELQEEKLNEI